MISTLSCSVGYGTFAVYVYGQDEFELKSHIFRTIPLLCFSFIIFMANMGIMNLPFIILVELLPIEVRKLADRDYFYYCFYKQLIDTPFVFLFRSKDLE